MKKTLLVLSFAAISISNAYSISEKSDWSSIRVDRKVAIIQPKFAASFGSAGLFNVCATDDEFKSINPVDVCVSYEIVNGGSPNSDAGVTSVSKCVRREKQDVSIERTTTHPVCLKHVAANEGSSNECIEWGNRTTTLPTTYALEVVRRGIPANEQSAGQPGERLFRKSWDVPACN